MDPNVKQRWLAALRSRKIRQARRTLAGLNDDGVPFAGIAEVIEEHL